MKVQHAAAMLALTLLITTPAWSRTIQWTIADVEKMAAIAPHAPLMSWAGFEYTKGTYTTASIDLSGTNAFLLRFPVERLPKRQRISNAELSIPVTGISLKEEPRLTMRRLLADWGPGVSYLYSRTLPEKRPWGEPGARASGSDRVAKPSVLVKVVSEGELVVNVTEDLELWYTGAAPNQGWIFNVDDARVAVRLLSPWSAKRDGWKLRITHEPE